MPRAFAHIVCEPLRGQTGLVEYAGPVSPDYATYTVALATDGAHGEVTQNLDGSLRYTADGDFMGWDSFTYTVSDGTHTSAPVNVGVHVTNGLPMAEDAELTVPWLEATDIPASTIINGATDPDGDALTVQIVDQPYGGTLTDNQDGTFTFTPTAEFAWPTFFTYVLTDGVTSANFGDQESEVLGGGRGVVHLTPDFTLDLPDAEGNVTTTMTAEGLFPNSFAVTLSHPMKVPTELYLRMPGTTTGGTDFGFDGSVVVPAQCTTGSASVSAPASSGDENEPTYPDPVLVQIEIERLQNQIIELQRTGTGDVERLEQLLIERREELDTVRRERERMLAGTLPGPLDFPPNFPTDAQRIPNTGYPGGVDWEGTNPETGGRDQWHWHGEDTKHEPHWDVRDPAGRKVRVSPDDGHEMGNEEVFKRALLIQQSDPSNAVMTTAAAVAVVAGAGLVIIVIDVLIPPAALRHLAGMP